MNYCIECGKKKKSPWGNRCRSCSKREKLNPSYTTGWTLKRHYCIDCGKEKHGLGRRCNSCARKKWHKDRGSLVRHFCLDCGKEIHHQAKRCRNCAQKESWKNPSDKRIKAVEKNGRKVGLLPKTEKQRKNWVSSWEDKFYNEYLEPIFGYDLQRQYYIREINHRFDFVILDSRVLIEIDCNYWHQFHEERDAQIDEWAKQNDWTMFRYNDEDLKKLGII